MSGSETDRIRALNDEFRRTLVGGRVVLTSGVAALSDEDRTTLLRKVQSFETFTPDNDPHGEHDFGTIEEGEQKVFWKIDYYDAECRLGSEDPTDPASTTRVLTLMLADEY
jgi:hypothetical protein